MPKRKYALATGAGVFFDDESGLKVLQGKIVEVDASKATEKTRLAISSGALLEVSDEEKSQPKEGSKSKDQTKSDLPEDIPGRDAFIAANMNFESVKTFDFETGKVPGIGARTLLALGDYLKKPEETK
ncbi:MAG TPA: hypothetical protein PKY59_22540 [Pyrinomonadaceae bacterium]|nr:hypothetical protein [Pyrinomonadaceae bacterium]